MEAAPQASEVSWGQLSERSQACLRLCWPQLLMGWQVAEMAAGLGVTASALSDALGQLREELQGVAFGSPVPSERGEGGRSRPLSGA